MRTTTLDTAERGRSPLGAHIRFLMDGPHGDMIHSTVPPGMVGRACHFRIIDEYWYVLSGEGEIWRRAPDGRESVTRLMPGVCIDIPLGTAFQYRCTGALREPRSPGRRRLGSGLSTAVTPWRPSPRCRRAGTRPGPRAAPASSSA